MASNEQKSKLNKNIILLIILVPLLVLVGVVAGYYLLPTGDGEETVSAESEKVEEVEEVVVPLEEFLVNLNPSANSNHYVRMTIALGSKDEDGEEIINENIEKIRDIVNYTTIRQTRETLFDENGRLTLKAKLVQAINQSLDADIISNIYVTEFVVQ